MPDPHGTVPKYSTQYSTIHRMLATITTVSAFSAICAFTPTLAMPQASASETASSTTITQVPDPLVSYTFSSDDGSGKVANTSSTSQFGSAQIMIGQDVHAQPATGKYADHALHMDGETWVKLPDNLLKNQASATVNAVIKTDEFSISNQQWVYLFTLGGHRAQLEGSWAASTHNSLFTSITSKGNGEGETYYNSPEILPTEKFALLSITVDGNNKTSSIFINGRLVATSPISATPGQFKAHNWNVIGESTYPGPGDGLFHGALKSFAVYNQALTQQQIVTLLDADGVADLLNGEADTLTAPSQATIDFTVKTATNNAQVVWSSDNEQVISVDAQGKARVYPSDRQDSTVTLTATLSPNTGITGPPEHITRTFSVSVPRKLTDQQAAEADK